VPTDRRLDKTGLDTRSRKMDRDDSHSVSKAHHRETRRIRRKKQVCEVGINSSTMMRRGCKQWECEAGLMNDGAITVFTTRPLSSVARSLSAVSVPITRTAMHAQSSCEHGVSVIILCHARRFTQRHGTATGCNFARTSINGASVRPG